MKPKRLLEIEKMTEDMQRELAIDVIAELLVRFKITQDEREDAVIKVINKKYGKKIKNKKEFILKLKNGKFY